MLRRLARSTAAHVAFAFLAMGAWTFLVNAGHGARTWIAALGQGLLSAIITLVLKRVLEATVPRFAGLLAYLAPPAITAAVILGVLGAAHLAIGTPQIVRTIAVPWTVSTLYAILYTAALARRGDRLR